MYFIYFVIAFAGIVGSAFLLKILQHFVNVKKVARELSEQKITRMPFKGSAESFSLMPLIDFYSVKDELKTEPGVSYFVNVDGYRILMDTGLNSSKSHPSPLLSNMQLLEVDPGSFDSIFISHGHLDHVGGFKEQNKRQFSLSQGKTEPGAVPVYAVEEILPSKWNPGPELHLVKEPMLITDSIASIGPYPRCLFLMGKTLEHSLAINLKGKGIVLVIGCGHQTIEAIIKRTRELFDEKIYAIIGGLHFPVKEGRIMAGPLNMQNIAGSERLPWNGINENDVMNSIEAIKEVDPQIISLSAHDSSDWSIDQFKKAFGEKFTDLRVGSEIIL